MICGQVIAKHSKLPHGVRYPIDYGSHVRIHPIQNFYFCDNLDMIYEVLRKKIRDMFKSGLYIIRNVHFWLCLKPQFFSYIVLKVKKFAKTE